MNSNLFVDWKTTAAGAGAAVATAVATILTNASTGGPELSMKDLAYSISLAVIGFLARDSHGPR